MHEQAKDADRLEPKGKVAGTGAKCFPSHGRQLPVERENLNHSQDQSNGTR